MTLKNAALLALIGMFMLTVLIAAESINTLLGVARNLIPAMALLKCVVYLFACVCVTVFFYVFSRSQGR